MRTGLFMTIVLVLLALPITGMQATADKQETANVEAPKIITKVFQLQHQDVEPLRGLLTAFGVHFYPGHNPRTVAIVGTPEKVAAVEETLKRLDVPNPPTKNVDLTVYLVAGLQQPAQESIPKELEPVTKQLKGLFSYQGFRLLDTLIVRARDGQGGEASGVGPATGPAAESGQKTVYQIRFGTVRVLPNGQGNSIRIDELKLGARVPVSIAPGNVQFLDTGFGTNIDVREGQKVVVGKANIDGANAMILVVTAKVVD